MSHFTRLRTRMVDREFLRTALQDLGYSVEVGDVQVSGWGGRKTRAELKVKTNNPGYDIGFVKSGDAYDLVADWYGIRGIGREELLSQLGQRYAYNAARSKLEQEGFHLVQEETRNDGEVHLVLRRMA